MEEECGEAMWRQLDSAGNSWVLRGTLSSYRAHGKVPGTKEGRVEVVLSWLRSRQVKGRVATSVCHLPARLPASMKHVFILIFHGHVWKLHAAPRAPEAMSQTEPRWGEALRRLGIHTVLSPGFARPH